MPDSYGVDRFTGKRLEGWPHVEQSIGAIFTTRRGSRVMRREIGGALYDLVGRPGNKAVVLRAYAAAKLSLVLEEPRFDLQRCVAKPAPDGSVPLEVGGVYIPRGHLGDPTPEAGEVFRMATVRLVAGGFR